MSLCNKTMFNIKIYFLFKYALFYMVKEVWRDKK